MSDEVNVRPGIVAFRGERGSYNAIATGSVCSLIVAFRGERGSYNVGDEVNVRPGIVAFRGERGSYNL